MRYSRTYLAWKYVNRSQNFTAAAVLLIFGTMFTALFVPTLARDLRLASSGVTTRATVLGKQIASGQRQMVAAASLLAHGGGRSKRHQLQYEFQVGGRAYGRTESVPRDLWDAVGVGGPVAVVYLPSDPNVCRAGVPLWQTGLMIPLGIGLTALVGAAVCLGFGVRDVRRRVRLICDGLPALGLIDEVRLSSTRRGRQYIEQVTYRYLVAREMVNRRSAVVLRRGTYRLRRARWPWVMCWSWPTIPPTRTAMSWTVSAPVWQTGSAC